MKIEKKGIYIYNVYNGIPKGGVKKIIIIVIHVIPNREEVNAAQS